MPAQIVEVNVGATAVVGERRGRPLLSAIVKQPVAGRVPVGELGLEHDQQHNRKYHGGPHQAVYAYAQEDAAWWSTELGLTTDASILGHNLTTSGVDVSGVVVGEQWAVGSTLLEATGPRIPCATLAKRVGLPGMVKRFAAAGRPGAYFRVLRTGDIGAGDTIDVVTRPDDAPPMAEVMAILLSESERAGELVGLAALNPTIAEWAAERV